MHKPMLEAARQAGSFARAAGWAIHPGPSPGANLRACQLLLGHGKLESAVRYLGIEVDDALELSEHLDLWRRGRPSRTIREGLKRLEFAPEPMSAVGATTTRTSTKPALVWRAFSRFDGAKWRRSHGTCVCCDERPMNVMFLG